MTSTGWPPQPAGSLIDPRAAAVLESLRNETAETLGALLPAGEPVALIDVPSHRNFGDHLLHLGQLQYLHRIGVPLRLEATMYAAIEKPLATLHPEGPILLQGGGNFGDLWHDVQTLRERFITTHRDRRILMMPNSIYFREEANLRIAQEAFSSHPDLTILLRDARSIEFAEAHFPSNRIVYCPDIGLGCPVSLPQNQSPDDVIMLRRGDRDDDIWVLPTDVSCTTTDWDLPRHRDRIARVLALPDRIGNKLPPLAVTSARLRTATYPRISRICVDEALRTLAKGRVLVTDRMHAAVMGAMLGMPTVALDLAYRNAGTSKSIGAIHEQKLSAAYEVWMGRFPNVVLLRDPAGIQQTVADLMTSR